MLADKSSSLPPIDNPEAEQTVCGDYGTLRPAMLNSLLILATESDWALSTILQVNYITPLEEYCEKTEPCDVPTSLQNLLSLIGKSSEADCVRICESSLPSFLLDWVISISDENVLNAIGECLVTLTSTLRSFSSVLAHHKTQFLAFLDHCGSTNSSSAHVAILARLCNSPQLDVSKMALKVLTKRCKSDSETRTFLETLKVPSVLTDSSSELVPFAARLCSTLAEHVSEMKSLFTESSASDGTISALSAALPSKSQLLNGNTVVVMLCEGLSLLHSLLFHMLTFPITESDPTFFPILKSTIIVFLDLLELLKSESVCPAADQTDVLIEKLDGWWVRLSYSLGSSHKSLHPVVESTFSDVPQLCSLLERTCRLSSLTRYSHLRMIVEFCSALPHMLPRVLEENLVQRVIDSSQSMTVPTTNCQLHSNLVLFINNLIGTPKVITEDKEEWKRIRKLQFERALKPAKRYLQLILQRDKDISWWSGDRVLSAVVTNLLSQTLMLERDVFEDGENVETESEEWEVWWLVEKTNDRNLGERLKMIREDDLKMKKDEKSRWKKRVERRREAGHEDAMEGWLTRRDRRTPSEIVEYLKQVRKESGMNVNF
ncbi:hypothetical protein BLNAU_5861 [Blattamonas nauphoetae]|uniref:Uncharacterized protein n=1 Tax=Blattamonas nauphoetae TaxID=2049346 RepID=A0ABQ9Y5N5_9EUKA|nr:hypothetical protein BLNAU_5861 [Blattamonas nauphoetae]